MYFVENVNCFIALTIFVIRNSDAQTCSRECDKSTLKLVHVVFRHGNRTIDVNTAYPKDPYINETYCPYGFGQLTNKGKQKQYLLGKALRLRYNQFLGSLYTPDVVDPVSTGYNRTKMSLACFLAGLYPPKGTPLEWDTDLDWTPIPYNYLDFGKDDHLISFPLYFCPKYAKLYEEYLNSAAGKALNEQYKQLFDYTSKHTGLNITSLIQISALYLTLVTQEDWGFKLPSWTKKVYPEQMDEASGQFYFSSSSTSELKKLSGGFLLKKILSDTQARIDNTLNPPGRKLFIYSAHDMNVAYVLSAMNVFTIHEPPFSACVMIELHKIDYVYGIKIFYQDYAQLEPKLLKVPGCDYFCPYDQFVALLEKNLPTGDNPCEDDLSKVVKNVSLGRRMRNDVLEIHELISARAVEA